MSLVVSETVIHVTEVVTIIRNYSVRFVMYFPHNWLFKEEEEEAVILRWFYNSISNFCHKYLK